MRFASLRLDVSLWLKSGRASVLSWPHAHPNYAKSTSHLDPALIGMMMHDLVREVMHHDRPLFLLGDGWDRGQS
jgi:hypothetical protein